MAVYAKYGTAPGLFAAGVGRSFASNLIYQDSSGFGVSFADGSAAFFAGTGLDWDRASGKFTAGTVTAINHYSDGLFNDSLDDLSLSAVSCQALFEYSTSPYTLSEAFFSGNDVLDGRHRLNNSQDPMQLIGHDGNDTIYGGPGDDLLGGEGGDDVIYGNGGNDKIFGGSGQDKIFGGDGNDRVNAGSGDDIIKGEGGRDILYGADGSDSYFGGADVDTAVYARSFYDLVITPTDYGFSIVEPHGVDTLTGIERIACDEGTFVYRSAKSVWRLIDTKPGELLLNPGSSIEGSRLGEVIDLAGTGKTMAFGLGGKDKLIGTTGFDVLFGGNGRDVLFGDNNNTNGNLDRLHGGQGNDRLFGQVGNDILYGGDGGDLIDGGIGNDELTGGRGADTFQFRWNGKSGHEQTWGHDVIRDFEIGQDHISLDFLNLPSWTDTTPDFYQVDAGAMITLTGAGSIFLEGVDATGLTIWDLLV